MSSFINRLYFFAFLNLFGLVLNAQDDINITSPHAGDVYAGDDLIVSLSYASPDSGYSSPRWAYSSSSYAWQSVPEVYSTQVSGSQWLNYLFDGYDSTRTLYVRLLDQANGAVLASDQRTFTYRSGSAPTQSGGGGAQTGTSGDSITIQKPYSGESVNSSTDELRINYSYSSASGGTQSPRWAYQLYDPNYGTPFSSYSSSHGGTQVDNMVSKYDFMSGLSDGSYTVYVTLLDSLGDMFNPPIVDHVSFGYQSSTGGTQSGGGDYQTPTSGTQSPDSIYILFPTPQFPSNLTPKLWLDASNLTNAGATWADRSTFGNDATKFGSPVLEQHNDSGLNTMRYSGSGDYHQFPEITDIRTVFWVVSEDSDATGHRYLLGTNYGTAPFWHDDGNGNMFGQSWADSKVYNGSTRLNGLAVNGRTTPKPHNLSVISHVTTGNVSATNFSKDRNWSDRLWKGKLGELIIFNTELSDADIRNVENYLGEKWKIPGLRTLYEDDGNDLQVQWNYQSQDNGMQSVSWAYKLNEDFYGTSTSATQVDGNDSVEGSTWLSGVSYGSHTLYVALLDQTDSNNVLDTDHHTFNYQSSGSSYTSPSNNTQSDPGGTQSEYNLIKLSSPEDPYLIGTSGNDLEIEWSYASSSGGTSSPHWSYKLNEDYSTGSAGSTQTNAMVPGSAWLGGVNDGWHTLYVALLDEQGGGQELSYATYTFNYQSSGSAVQSPDGIAMVYPDVTYLHSSDSNGLQVHWNYQSQSDAEQSLSWAYSLDGSTYSSPVNGTKHVAGSTWLNGLSYDWHELRVALLDQASGAQLAYASHMFKYESGNAGTQSPTGGTSQDHHNNLPYFSFSSNDLNTLASGASLPEGNYTILKEHNASDSQPFQLAPVFKDSSGYILVEINASVDSSATFAELESYLDSTQIVEQGYVDFMPFDFLPIQRIDVNQSSALLSLSNGYDEIYFQEFNDTQNNTRYWTLSIEEDGNETNKSSLVVDMAGFVYEGNFEDYWYHTFGIAVYAPNTEPEQKHADWNETEYNADSQGISAVLQNHQHDLSFRQMLLVSNLEISENTPAQSTISQFSLSVPRIMGDLNFTVYSDISTVSSALAIDQQGNLRSLTSFDFETSNQISFATRATDPFGRSIEGNFSLTVLNQVEDYDGDGVEDHIDTDDDNDTFSDSIEQQYGFDPRNSSSHPNFPGVSTAEEILLSSGAYRLGGTLLATGGVQVTEYGIRLKQANESIFQIYRAANLGATNSYSLDFGALEIGEDYFYQAYATNLAGTSLGALKKFTTSVEQFWWSSATELSGGWKSSWVGEFLPYENGWIYHVDLGWAFVKPDLLGGIWMWVDDEGWLWSSEEAWPFLWASNTKNWLYPMNVGVRTYLYDYSSESVRSR